MYLRDLAQILWNVYTLKKLYTKKRQKIENAKNFHLWNFTKYVVIFTKCVYDKTSSQIKQKSEVMMRFRKSILLSREFFLEFIREEFCRNFFFSFLQFSIQIFFSDLLLYKDPFDFFLMFLRDFWELLLEFLPVLLPEFLQESHSLYWSSFQDFSQRFFFQCVSETLHRGNVSESNAPKKTIRNPRKGPEALYNAS